MNMRYDDILSIGARVGSVFVDKRNGRMSCLAGVSRPFC